MYYQSRSRVSVTLFVVIAVELQPPLIPLLVLLDFVYLCGLERLQIFQFFVRFCVVLCAHHTPTCFPAARQGHCLSIVEGKLRGNISQYLSVCLPAKDRISQERPSLRWLKKFITHQFFIYICTGDIFP